MEAESEQEKEIQIAPGGPLHVGNSAGPRRLDLDTIFFRHPRISLEKGGLTSATTEKPRIPKSQNHENNRTCQQNSNLEKLKVDGRLENTQHLHLRRLPFEGKGRLSSATTGKSRILKSENNKNNRTCQQNSDLENLKVDGKFKNIQTLHLRRPPFDAGRGNVGRVGSVEEGSSSCTGEDMGDGGRGDADTEAIVTQPCNEKIEKDLCPEGDQCEDRDCIYQHPSGYSDRYWSTYAIKEWLREWFRQNPMKTWSIDNYDGEESYEELHLETNERHMKEPRLKAEIFHKLRSILTIIEAEMDEVLDNIGSVGEDERKREWNNWNKVAISVCDEYIHAEVFESCEGYTPKQKQRVIIRNDSVLATQCQEKNHIQLEDDHVEEVRDDHVVLDHDANPKGEQVRFGALGKPLKRPHTRRRRRDNLEESAHASGDQEMFVDRNGREAEDPLGTEADPYVWKHQGQAYAIGGWSKQRNIKEEADKHINCMLKGQHKARRQREYEPGGDSSGEENEQMACNVTGQNWESLPFPIIVDSGTCASVMPTGWCEHIPIQSTLGSEAGEFFRAANGLKIPNEGERMVSMMTKEGIMRDMRFTVCPVTKALGSVSQMCKIGHRVIFNPPWDPEGSYIQNINIGERLWLEERNGLYVLNIKVAPTHKQTPSRRNNNQGFHRQVMS